MRAERGVREKGSGITVLGGVSSLWGRCRYIFADQTSTDGVLRWLDSIKHFLPESGAVIVLDNHPSHATARVKQRLWELHLTPLFIPPTASEFNPVETYWSWFKHAWRKKVSNSSLILDLTNAEGHITDALEQAQLHVPSITKGPLRFMRLYPPEFGVDSFRLDRA